MSVEKEIREYLESKTKGLSTDSRDVGLILYYYGFGGAEWPTLEEAAIEFDVGDSEGRRSERPRQIINNKFRNEAKIKDFPSLVGFLDVLRSDKVHSSEALRSKCSAYGLLDEEGSLVALLRLLHDLGEGRSYKAYSSNLNELTRNGNSKSQDTLIAEKESALALRAAIKKAKTMPGLIGIAKLEYLAREFEKESIDADILLSILKKDPDSWFCSDKGVEYYLFESRDNALVNSLEKIKNISDSAEIDVLTDTLSNSLKRRTPPKGREYPPKDIIKKYLLSSKHTKINGDIVFLKVDPESLTDVQQDVVAYMKENDVDDYPTISSHLVYLGYGKPAIDKAVFHSPLVHVDKSGGRGHYKYRLIGSEDGGLPNISSEYEKFRQRLLKASSEGTNGDAEVITRKEHHILSEWLFKGKEFERCAICGRTYAVKSLVTAHKKRRADCAENERTDPHIVMPLCNFGCDYMYEAGLIYVYDGTVCVGSFAEDEYFDELDLIKKIRGNPVPSKWLEGSSDYFNKA